MFLVNIIHCTLHCQWSKNNFNSGWLGTHCLWVKFWHTTAALLQAAECHIYYGPWQLHFHQTWTVHVYVIKTPSLLELIQWQTLSLTVCSLKSQRCLGWGSWIKSSVSSMLTEDPFVQFFTSPATMSTTIITRTWSYFLSWHHIILMRSWTVSWWEPSHWANIPKWLHNMNSCWLMFMMLILMNHTSYFWNKPHPLQSPHQTQILLALVIHTTASFNISCKVCHWHHPHLKMHWPIKSLRTSPYFKFTQLNLLHPLLPPTL